ncbi:flagellar hook-associated protein FlgL [Trinickia dinghuensis]|uniref:Flagellar hook-associated protein 3 n=1 Tax=Trinickia dinghuensis TaxID=2291023 RepID=A0A3D8K0W9_9BURK|nr:flagellar hook-associated protein FlgL [Trinickia dinghuensis]RDU98566.1 flagellar hook-associated protein 3 [Trinickia dinghuensis]
MRISTSQFYNQNIQTMDNQEAQLGTYYQQLSSGTALTTPADNPLGAAQAVQLTMVSATYTQYQTNQNSALSSLQLEDKTLSSVTSTMQAITSEITRAGDGTLNDSDRASIAQALEGYRSQLMNLANTSDGAGNYLFSGFQATTPPFTNNPAGGVNYQGDNGIRESQVADTRQIATNDSGSSVFLSVPATGTSPVAASGASNTGTGTISAPSITNPAVATNGDSYTITFGGTSAAPTYTVTDNTAVPPTTTAATAFSANTPISLGAGMQVQIKGAPAPGDTFTATPSTAPGNTSVFQTLDSIISALQQPAQNNPTATASLENALTTGTTRFQNSLTNVTVVQASVGGREQELQALQTTTQTNSLQTQSDLSNLTGVDMVSAISKFEETQNALQAAQQTFVKMQGMSLFQYLGS